MLSNLLCKDLEEFARKKAARDLIKKLALANGVKSFLVEAGQVEPERIYIFEPNIGEGESGAKRAEMIIK